jgi:hypothetical protein
MLRNWVTRFEAGRAGRALATRLKAKTAHACLEVVRRCSSFSGQAAAASPGPSRLRRGGAAGWRRKRRPLSVVRHEPAGAVLAAHSRRCPRHARPAGVHAVSGESNAHGGTSVKDPSPPHAPINHTINWWKSWP